jgi:alpha-beta hydrolase superfamily lysophospholipase
MLPSGSPPFACVIFVHGLGSSKDSPRNVVVASRLVDSGMAALLFDLSGHGESDTDARLGEEPYIEDLSAAFRWVSGEPGIDPERIGVAGSSLGAVVALCATRRLLIRPAALVLRAPPIEPGDLDDIAVPTLVVIGTQDHLITRVRMAAAWTRWAILSVVDGAGHLFEEPGTLEQAVERTVSWFSRYLLPPCATNEADRHGEVDEPEWRGRYDRP